jgi:transposase InsO family protein
VIAYIDEHRDQFGVQPICQVLKEHGVAIAPSTCYAAKKRPPSARAVHDAWLSTEITRVYKENGEVYGARKVWLQLHREHTPDKARHAGRIRKGLAACCASGGHADRLRVLVRRRAADHRRVVLGIAAVMRRMAGLGCRGRTARGHGSIRP